MLISEKNRLQSPAINIVRDTITAIIEVIKKQMESITDQIKNIISDNPELKRKQEVLKTIPGIGDIASLAGVAPRANESDKCIGYRSVGHGRSNIKPILFMAAMAARKSRS